MTTIICYLWAISSAISICLLWMGLICLIVSIIHICCNISDRNDRNRDEEEILPLKKIVSPGKKIIFAFIFFIMSSLIPNKEDIALIYVAPKIVNSEVIRKDFPEIFELGTKILRNKLKEVSKEEVKESLIKENVKK